MKPKPTPKRSKWPAALAALYVGGAGGGIGTATYLDATRTPPVIYAPAPPQRDAVYIPPEALDPAPMGGAPLAPCPSDAVLKDEAEQTQKAQSVLGTVVVGELNVREAPGGRIKGQLFRGDEVEILERRVNGGGLEWARTRSGWVAARFLDTGGPVDPAPGPLPASLPPPPCPFPQAMCLPGTTSMFNQ